MIDTDALRLEIKKLSAAALKAKMDLHDLAEDLPIGHGEILAVAQRAHEAYETLERKREELKSATVGAAGAANG